MKKAVIGVLAAIAVLTIGSTSVFAAGCGRGRYYVDQNGDGVCDNYAGYGQGRYYVDENGDGICDNYTARPYGGRGYGRGGRCRR